MLKLATIAFVLYALWAANQSQYHQVKWALIGAGCSIALILMKTWREWYLESLSQ